VAYAAGGIGDRTYVSAMEPMVLIAMATVLVLCALVATFSGTGHQH